jgi:type IV pilus biogenesis protein CpaD/CtpE
MNYRVTMLLLILIVLTGCATRPISNIAAIPAPMERIFDTHYLQAIPGTGEVIIKRDRGLLGSACSTRIFVDGRPVADIQTSEKIVLYLPEGNHILSAWPNGICAGGMAEVKAVIKAGTHSSYRVSYGSNGDFTISPTAF